MPTVSSIMNPTLKNIVDRTAPNGGIATIIEAAEISMPIIADATFVECNNGDAHDTVIRAGLPELAERRYNQGIKETKTETMKVKEQTAMMEDLSRVDAKLAEKSGNVENYRASEVVGKTQAANIWLGRNFIYGSPELSADTFMGVAPRYGSKAALSGDQIVDAGGTGSDNTSMYLITWGGKGANLLYPEGSVAGFEHKDMTPNGPQLIDAPITTADRKQMLGYVDWLGIHLGMTLGDYRSGGRIANIDVSDLKKDATTGGADLLDLLVDLKWKVNTDYAGLGIDMQTGELVQGRSVLYVNRTVAAFLDKQARNAKGLELRHEQVLGRDAKNRFQLYYGDWEIRVLDSILNTEARVV